MGDRGRICQSSLTMTTGPRFSVHTSHNVRVPNPTSGVRHDHSHRLPRAGQQRVLGEFANFSSAKNGAT